MKPKTFNKKLVLKKATIANLNHRQMNSAHGGNVGIGIVEPGPDPVPVTTDQDTCPCSVPECITDPPTECYTCPYTWNNPCCPQPTDTVEPA
ncbi:MAG: hypothetical protein GTO45_31145 [Candidatus Aminicenantes bacterium]|nr:hypothetical protein [Candidatus Aminicenantes bacterium]NIM83255.1 hypothetical protein [Candidatus Aminicenantes bacterium]NIN22626.1 hypothetical protein [Candidatus Aminicenantes bacterium]NIN46385.1 hypothetical protein [Candidatus Aminicenantes bacterium]NIN89235.1 hypothetical protein [Candidatus Aminicenantes bacterium]